MTLTTTEDPCLCENAAESDAARELLECIELASRSPSQGYDPAVEDAALRADAERVTLRSGRRYDLAAGHDADTITVRSASGQVLLRVVVGEAGPLLSFESAEITLSARHRLALSAPEVAVTAGTLHIHAGSAEEVVEGDRHTRIRGEERVEAGAVAIQSNSGSVSMRAAEHIALDGSHIGLNDDPCPAPFGWSEPACNAHRSRGAKP